MTEKSLTHAQNQIPVHHFVPASGDTHIDMFCLQIHFVSACVGNADAALMF